MTGPLRPWVPAAMGDVLDRLAAHGELWLVGGTVFDRVRQRPCREVDAVLAAGTDALRAAGGVPIGGDHETHAWRTEDGVVEVSPMAVDGLASDLARRDFTMHAMAMRWPDGLTSDPHGGRRDRELRRLRVPGSGGALAEDPLRILRGFRRAAEGLRWTPSAAADAVAALPGLDGVARQRFGPEVVKLLVAPAAGYALRVMARWPGLLAALHPGFPALAALPPPGNHRYSIWRHSSLVVDALPRDPALRLAGLFHDLGKAFPWWAAPAAPPPTATSFHLNGHAEISAREADRCLQDWGVERPLRKRTVRLVAGHSIGIAEMLDAPAALRRWIAIHGADVDDLITFRYADRWASGKTKGHADIDRFAAAVDQVRRQPFPRHPSELAVETGPLLAELAVPPPQRSEFLDRLWRWVLEDPPGRNRTAAIRDEAARLADR